jgi:hypothetical protein
MNQYELKENTLLAVFWFSIALALLTFCGFMMFMGEYKAFLVSFPFSCILILMGRQRLKKYQTDFSAFSRSIGMSVSVSLAMWFGLTMV